MAAESEALEQMRDDSRERTLAKRVQQRRLNEQVGNAGKRRGPCTRDTARCPEARVMLLDTPECCLAHVRGIMRDLTRIFDREGIRWWADYGTLLGFLQFGGMIPWDKDGDLGILAEDREKLLGLRGELMALGYYPTYAPVRPTERFRTGDRLKVRLSAKNHSNVDVFIWCDRPGGMLDRINYIGSDLYKGRQFPREWALPLGRGQWDGIEISLPHQPEKLAAHRYGEKWQEPLRIKHPLGVRK